MKICSPPTSSAEVENGVDITVAVPPCPAVRPAIRLLALLRDPGERMVSWANFCHEVNCENYRLCVRTGGGTTCFTGKTPKEASASLAAAATAIATSAHQLRPAVPPKQFVLRAPRLA